MDSKLKAQIIEDANRKGLSASGLMRMCYEEWQENEIRIGALKAERERLFDSYRLGDKIMAAPPSDAQIRAFLAQSVDGIKTGPASCSAAQNGCCYCAGACCGKDQKVTG